MSIQSISIKLVGGKRADDFILELADRHGSAVISNDNYSDSKYSKYKWKDREAEPMRLFMGEVIPVPSGNHLILFDLEINVVLTEPSDKLYRKLHRILYPPREKFEGSVKFVNNHKGWGRIVYTVDDEVNFRTAELSRAVEQGHKVKFVIEETDKGEYARNIEVLDLDEKRIKGRVVQYDEGRGMGAIKPEDDGEDLFFYKSYFHDPENIPKFSKGQRISYVLGTNSKGDCAKKIKIEDEDPRDEQIKLLKDRTTYLEEKLRSREDEIKRLKQGSSEPGAERTSDQNAQRPAQKNRKQTPKKEEGSGDTQNETSVGGVRQDGKTKPKLVKKPKKYKPKSTEPIPSNESKEPEKELVSTEKPTLIDSEKQADESTGIADEKSKPKLVRKPNKGTKDESKAKVVSEVSAPVTEEGSGSTPVEKNDVETPKVETTELTEVSTPMAEEIPESTSAEKNDVETPKVESTETLSPKVETQDTPKVEAEPVKAVEDSAPKAEGKSKKYVKKSKKTDQETPKVEAEPVKAVEDSTPKVEAEPVKAMEDSTPKVEDKPKPKYVKKSKKTDQDTPEVEAEPVKAMEDSTPKVEDKPKPKYVKKSKEN